MRNILHHINLFFHKFVEAIEKYVCVYLSVIIGIFSNENELFNCFNIWKKMCFSVDWNKEAKKKLYDSELYQVQKAIVL